MKLTRQEYERLSMEDKREHLASLEPDQVATLFVNGSPLGSIAALAPRPTTAQMTPLRPQIIERRIDFNPWLLLIILLLCWPTYYWFNQKFSPVPVDPQLAQTPSILPSTTPQIINPPAALPAASASPSPPMVVPPPSEAIPLALAPPAATINKFGKVIQPPNTRLITYLVEGTPGTVKVHYRNETGHLVEKMVTIPWKLNLFMPYDADFSLSAQNPVDQVVWLRATVFFDTILYKRDEKTSIANEVLVSGVVLKYQ